MLVGMNHALVFVSMRMANGGRQAGMAMMVVTVIMAMDMFVAKRLMHVDMNMGSSRRSEIATANRAADRR